MPHIMFWHTRQVSEVELMNMEVVPGARGAEDDTQDGTQVGVGRACVDDTQHGTWVGEGRASEDGTTDRVTSGYYGRPLGTPYLKIGQAPQFERYCPKAELRCRLSLSPFLSIFLSLSHVRCSHMHAARHSSRPAGQAAEQDAAREHTA